MFIAQALLQIIVESLPFSSSGHVALVEQIMGWQPLSSACEYLLHGPTILVLIIYFRATWYPLVLQWLRFHRVLLRMVLLGIIADGITALVYFAVKPWGSSFPLSLGFLITLLLLCSLRLQRRTTYVPMTLGKAVGIGFVQGCAGLPGISRLASTVVVGIWLGLSPRKAFSVSCMLQFPLISAAFVGGLLQHDGTCTFLFATPCTLILLLLATACAYALLWVTAWCTEQNKLWKLSYYLVVPLCISLFL